MEQTVIATSREASGRSAVRRLRREGKVPGIVYGLGEPVKIVLDHHRLQLDLAKEVFHSSVLDLQIDGKKQMVLLREVQEHPLGRQILHVDFQAVAADAEISATVPLHFENADVSPGVKLNHGVFSSIVSELEVHCLPKDLPENITVDVSHLEIQQTVHLSELTPPTGVKFDALARGEDPSLATVLPPQAEEVDDAQPEGVGEIAAEATAEADQQPKAGE